MNRRERLRLLWARNSHTQRRNNKFQYNMYSSITVGIIIKALRKTIQRKTYSSQYYYHKDVSETFLTH